ncbi:MAG: ribonucleotide reductase N-terminal alpha domain-containing protein [Acholeplasmataceae bacterium]|nr:ribonucleotide reductase N-terminal alpha domain-containing protein [Acholeplasmataceae bacterium]
MQPTENALAVLEKRYFLPGENWDGLCKRVAKAVANGDVELEKKYFQAINNFYFLPNSPCLMNGGTSIGNLSACFVLGLSDSMESIMDTAKDMSIVFRSGGGVGIDISALREEGAVVRETNGVASGAVSFMEIYNTVANVTKQGGKRRAALMGVMRVDHPEILDFIKVKNDRSKLNNFNLSVAVTDKFMKAAEKGENYDLISPKNGKVGELNAREVFNLIAQNAWENGEPGLLFIDTINRCNPIPQFGKISCTNPCFVGHEKLLTSDGWISFSEIHKKHGSNPFNIINKYGFMEQARVWISGEKDTVIMRLSDGSEIQCTPDHVFFSDGEEVCAKDMSKRLVDHPFSDNTEKFNKMFEFFGFIQGDGALSRLKSKTHLGLEINIGKKDHDIIEYFNGVDDIPSLKLDDEQRVLYLSGFKDKLDGFGFSCETLPSRTMPTTFNDWSLNDKLSFVRGCYSANGSVISKHRIAYKSTCKEFLSQMMSFLSEIGIHSYITTNKAKKVLFSNGEYLCRESYDLNITRAKSIVDFAMMIGFIQKYKSQSLRNLVSQRRLRVTSVRESSKEIVYDFNCDSHIGLVNHCVVHNCGEIPLLENEACNLLSINLKKLNTFEEIETTVRLGVRFLNGVLDVSTFPTESITKQVATTKKIGLGVMGWADYLAERMIPYDSKKARTEASELMANIEQCAHDESVKIANERNEYIETTMGKRRNGTLLCIAPTGTISMIADCSSSIEPYFALSYTKNVMDGQSLKYINDVLVRKLKEENLWCSEVKSQILKTGSIQHIDTIPDRIKCVFKTANEISIRGHIEMQAAFQKHVDNSISKTINLSSEATVNDVMLAYLDAYRLGVKGITIYRDGSRSGQVLTSPKARVAKCPECQSKSISHDSGCVTCQSCGWSICSI